MTNPTGGRRDPGKPRATCGLSGNNMRPSFSPHSKIGCRVECGSKAKLMSDPGVFVFRDYT